MASEKLEERSDGVSGGETAAHNRPVKIVVEKSLVGPHFVDHRSCRVNVGRDSAFAPIRVIGGRTGWYHADYLWKLRGMIDEMVGGVGIRRGRPNGETPRIGDVIDCWRVDEYKEGSLLRLEGELKLPGRAWLQFEVHDHGDESEIAQTALFESDSIWGALYWYSIYPVHVWVFRGMLRGIARAATLRQ